MNNENTVYQVLNELGIDYQKYEHEPLYTCEQADPLYDKLEGAHCKNIFLRNKKGDKYYLVVLESHKHLDLKVLRKDLGESKLSLGSPERLMNVLGVEPGSVSPFTLINDKENQCEVLIDEGLQKHQTVHFHPNVNTATLALNRLDFDKFMAWSGNQYRYEDLPILDPTG